ncbi:taperin isoform X2 [Eleginops maclovinus]|uniref:taperin isoform X2 n=1 Tax=Eleginops maclovinus TaxID=56733 RepID=UPI003080759E
MSGGGEVRVVRNEPGQESPRMPAWKREILERRKAKGGGSVGPGAAETSPGGAGSQRVNGEQAGNVNGSAGSGPSGASGRSYTINTASQHFAHNKEPTDADRTTPREYTRQENLVLQESLGPLEENPFIKLEKERRRRQDRENATRPVQHILELYGSVPGIRTIRADNIIIIESDPDYFPEAGGANSGYKWQNGVSSYSSLNDLLDRRGSAVTEIRAKEVVIYDTTLSKSEENLSTLGRPDHEAASYETGEGQGRVSRMLQKFDCNYGKLQKKSHSTENLLDLDCSSSSRPRLWSRPQPDLVPKFRPGPLVRSPGSSQPSSPVFQSPSSSRPKPQPAFPETGSPQRLAGTPLPVSPFRQRFAASGGTGDDPDRAQTKPIRERDWEGSEVPPKSKVPCSPETRRVRAEAPSSPISFKVSRSSSDFEIRPSPKPDLDRIPDGDTQARALANLRLQSRNSFTVIPKRHTSASNATASSAPSSPFKSPPSHRAAEVSTPVPTSSPSKRTEEKEAERLKRLSKPTSPSVATSPAPAPPLTPEPSSPPPAPKPAPFSPPAPSSPSSSPAVPSSPTSHPVPSDSPAPSPVPSTPSPAPEQPPVDQLPVTNIDDIEVEPQKQHVPAPSPMGQRRKGNTFTVVPKRKVEAEGQPSSPEPQQEASSEPPPVSTPPLAPYAQLGSLLKKRYPAVEEIEVIGGYLSLAKSCISKTGSTGKKLNISFNESSLQSTYEYPSETSAWDSGDEDEEEMHDGKVSDEQPSMVGRIHIPRPSFTSSPTQTNNDLSSYIPKHSVDFSAWQEHKHEEDNSSQQTQMTEEVMLTPADSSSLSDYSSEPALYF